MFGRTFMIAGGGIAVAATVAVGAVVAIGSASALADSPAEALDVAPIVVAAPPATPTATPTPTVTAEAVPAPVATPETVPAPQPKDVAAPAPAPSTPAPSATEAVDPMEELVASGSWQRARDWAVANGWDEQRIAAWIDAIRARYGESMDSSRTTPGYPGQESAQESPSSWHGSEKSRSQSSPDRD